MKFSNKHDNLDLPFFLGLFFGKGKENYWGSRNFPSLPNPLKSLDKKKNSKKTRISLKSKTARNPKKQGVKKIREGSFGKEVLSIAPFSKETSVFIANLLELSAGRTYVPSSGSRGLTSGRGTV